MSVGTKTKRLFKVAQEFNVGTQTIVDLLARNGFSVENKPNASITSEMYDVLETEYRLDKKSKLETDRVKDDYAQRRKERSGRPEIPSIELSLEPENILKPADDSTLEPIDSDVDPIESLPVIEEQANIAKADPELDLEPITDEIIDTEETVSEQSISNTIIEDDDEDDSIEDLNGKEFLSESNDDLDFGLEEDEEDYDDEIIRGRSDRLRGTTVLGKISLGTEDESRSGKKSRKKKKKNKPAENAAELPVIKPKVVDPITEAETDEEAAAQKKKKKRIKKTVPKAKVSVEEVDSKLKETITSLQAGSKGKQRQKRRKQKREEMAEKRDLQELMDQEDKSVLEVTEFMTVSELAELLSISPTQVITSCMQISLMVSINQRLDKDTIQLIADEYDKEIRFVDAEIVTEEILEEEEDQEKDLIARAPVVTVMGHVDHGKTSLLDYIKNSKVAEGEAGGITQHIGAYAVVLPDGKKITFLDTPGHEAFTAMRARGAQVTDIVILVVAADDSVMPQTIEAINHAQAAGVSIVVAINKIDKDGAKPEKIIQQLADHNVLVEDWGGNVQCAKVSAKKGTGIDDLLDKVLIEAELLDLKANPERKATGIVLETKLDRGKGVVANLLIQKGTLKVGDTFVAGNQYGRIRAMENEFGKRIVSAGPSTPIQVTGFDGAPQAGDKFVVTKDEKTAKEIASKRQQIKREQDLRKVKLMTLDDISRRMSMGEVSELNIIIKGDVDGSIEALSGALIKLGTGEVKVNIIHTGVGAISESDVLLATASQAIIIGFQVRPTANARKLAENEEVDIRLFSIIYEAVDLVRDALEGLLSPEISEKITSNVEVRDTFKVPGIGTIAGCYVLDGKIVRNSKVRLVRDGIVVYSGEISSLKRFKDDAKEVAAGYECGIGIKNFNDIKTGDIIESYEIVEKKRKLIIE